MRSSHIVSNNEDCKLPPPADKKPERAVDAATGNRRPFESGRICTTLGDRMQAQENPLTLRELGGRLRTALWAQAGSKASHRRFCGNPRVNLFKTKLVLRDS